MISGAVINQRNNRNNRSMNQFKNKNKKIKNKKIKSKITFGIAIDR